MEVSEGTQPRARRPEMSEKEWQNSLKASLVPPQPTAPLAPCTMEHNFSTISFFINGMTAGSRNPRTRTPWVRGSQSSEPTVFLEFHFPGLCWQTVLGFWCFRSFTGACLQTSSPSPSRPNVRTLPKSHPRAHRLRRANAKSDAMSDHGVGSPWRQSVQVCRWRRRSPGRPKKRRRRDAAARQVGRE